MRGRLTVVAFALATVGLAPAACGVAVEQGVGDEARSLAPGTAPTSGPPPTPPWVNEDGTIDVDRVPDLIPVSDRQGNRAGYIRKENHLAPPPVPTSPDFDPYHGQCGFSDCRHLSEPRCAAKAGTVDASRYASYLEILSKLPER